MMIYFSEKLRNEVIKSVDAAKTKYGIVNITTVAETLTALSPEKARSKELEEMILNAALQTGCAIEFGGFSSVDFVPAGHTVLEIELIPEPPMKM